MNYCPKCGTAVPDGSSFCTACGTRVSAPPEQKTVFCTACGEQLSASSTVCPNCGAAVDSDISDGGKKSQDGKKGGGARTAVIAVMFVVALGLVAALVYLAINLFSSPASKFLAYNAQVFKSDALSWVGEVANDRAKNGIDTDLTISGSIDLGDYSNANFAILDDASIVLKVDSDKDSALVNAEFNLGGSTVMTGSFTYDKGQIGLYLPELDDVYYVADLSEFFYNLTGETLDINDDYYPDISEKDVEKVLTPYFKILSSAFTKDSITVEKRQKVRFKGLSGSAECTVYTFRPDTDAIEDMLVQLSKQLDKDDDLRDLISKIFESGMGEAMEASYVSGYYYGNPPSMEDQIYDMLDELVDMLDRNADDFIDAIEDADFEWSVAVEGSEVRQVRVSFIVGRGEKGAITFEQKGDERDGMDQVVYLSSGSEIFTLFEHTYTRNKDVFEGRLTVHFDDYYDDEILTLEYSMDTGKISPLGTPYGEYHLSYPWEDIELTMTVEGGSKGSTDHTIHLEGYSYWYGNVSFSMTVNATEKSSAKKPSARTVDVTDYSEDQLMGILDGWEDSVQDLLWEIQARVYG